MKYIRIVSRNNELIKEIKKEVALYTLAMVEGPKLMQDIIARNSTFDYVFVDENKLKQYESLLRLLANSKIITSTDKLIQHLSEVENHQGITGFLKAPPMNAPDVEHIEEGIHIVLYQIQDPGNMGAMVRIAAAVNARGVILSPGCAHPMNPKAIRASAGAVFALKIAGSPGIKETLQELKKKGFILIIADQSSSTIYYEVDYKGSFVLIMGSEGSGVPLEIMNISDLSVSIPMHHGIESLNVASSAAIILYEAYRQQNQRIKH